MDKDRVGTSFKPDKTFFHKFLFRFFCAGILISSFLEAQYRLYITENNFANG